MKAKHTFFSFPEAVPTLHFTEVEPDCRFPAGRSVLMKRREMATPGALDSWVFCPVVVVFSFLLLNIFSRDNLLREIK